MGAEPRDVCRGRGGVDLVPIRVDVVQSCGGKADVSNLIAGWESETGWSAVRLMGARRLSYESLDSAPKRTFWAWLLTVGEMVSKLSEDMYSSSPVGERARGRAVGWEISHCPTRCVPFVYRENTRVNRETNKGRDMLTSSAAMVTVWFVAITGTIFACI